MRPNDSPSSRNIPSEARAERLGLFGGTFDPVHTGHLIAAEGIREAAGLDRVVFIPAARPPHKGTRRMFDAATRRRLLELATAANPGFTVSDIELTREGLSFTIDTIRQIRASEPAGTELSLIVGRDSLTDMGSWLAPREIAAACDRILVADRLIENDHDIPDWLMKKAELIRIPLVQISSSDIRRRIMAGESIRYLVPDTVCEEIRGMESVRPDGR